MHRNFRVYNPKYSPFQGGYIPSNITFLLGLYSLQKGYITQNITHFWGDMARKRVEVRVRVRVRVRLRFRVKGKGPSFLGTTIRDRVLVFWPKDIEISGYITPNITFSWGYIASRKVIYPKISPIFEGILPVVQVFSFFPMAQSNVLKLTSYIAFWLAR